MKEAAKERSSHHFSGTSSQTQSAAASIQTARENLGEQL